MWRTPHPDPNPQDGPTTGLSGASAIAMAYLPDGTVVFAERPHAIAAGVPNNPLLVNVSQSRVTFYDAALGFHVLSLRRTRDEVAASSCVMDSSAMQGNDRLQQQGFGAARSDCHWSLQADNVGALGSLYTVSYYGQDIPNGDTFIALDVQSQAFCVGVTVDYEGNAILVGGDNQGVGTIYRTGAEKAAGISFPNGYYDVRRYAPGGTQMTIPDSMYDVNSMTGAPNTARDCCIQLPTDPVAIPDTCVPDINCSPRCGNTIMYCQHYHHHCTVIADQAPKGNSTSNVWC